MSQRQIDELQECVARLQEQLRDRTDGEFNFQHLIDFQSSRLKLHFGYVYLESGVSRQRTHKLPQLPPPGSLLHEQLRREADISIACNVTIEFSKGVHSTGKGGTIRDSHHSISEPSGCKNPASLASVSERAEGSKRGSKKVSRDLQAAQMKSFKSDNAVKKSRKDRDDKEHTVAD